MTLRTIETKLGTAQVIGIYQWDQTKYVVQYPRGTVIPQDQRIPGLGQASSFALERIEDEQNT